MKGFQALAYPPLDRRGLTHAPSHIKGGGHHCATVSVMEGCHSCSPPHLCMGGDDACAPSAPLHRRCSLDVPFRPDVFCTASASQWIKFPTSGHSLTVCGFEPLLHLCADDSEHGACFKYCVSLSVCPFPTCVLSVCLSVCLSQKNSEAKNILKQLHQSTCLLALYPPLHGKVHFTDWKRQ